MSKNVKKVKCEEELADLVVNSNSSFVVEIYFEGEFVDRQYLYPGSRFRFINLTKGDKVVISSILNER